jgi:RNA polymerase sigma-70 factor (sigma-E family)
MVADRKGVTVNDAALRADFDAFARENWATLMSIGVAVSGSRAEAEDLVQTALTNAFVQWRRIHREQALAYLRRSILNANVSRWRRHRGAELTVADVPEAVPWRPVTDGVDDRQTLLPLLRALPPRQRAVLVLRYLCDLPDAEIAETLDVSAATVRSQAFRGLATLRTLAARPVPEVIR